MDLLGFLEKNWTVITQAPWAFATFAVIFFGLGYAFSSRSTAERLALAEARVSDYKDKLEGKSPDEAQAQLAQLREEVSALAAYGLSKGSQQKLSESLSGISGSVRILKTTDASDADRLYRQVVSIFRAAGLNVTSHAIMGLDDAPDSGVTLVHWSGTDEKLVEGVRRALQAAGFGATELVDPKGFADDTELSIVFSSRDPDWVPPARWG
ncbi:hypothetical protein [Rhizobium sp.]